MIRDRSWRRELVFVLAATAALCILGLAYGQALLFLLTGGLLYILWHLRHALRLGAWLEGTQTDPLPDARGIWGSLYKGVYRLRRRTRKRRRKLGRALQRFKMATAALPDATVVLDQDGAIEWWNTASESLLGLQRPVDRGQRIVNLIRNPAFVRRLEQGDWDQPLTIPSPVDEHVWLTVTVVATGRTKRLLIAQDSTRVHQLDQVRRDFVANVSHELRTPLTVVSGYVEALIDNEHNRAESLNNVLPQVYQQTQRMQRIVEDLLLLSRMELDADRNIHEPLSMAPMLHRIRDEALELSSSEGHRIELDMQPRLGIVGSAAELTSAFSNLAFNAVRYTPKGGDIRMRWFSDDKGAYFMVSDTGVGIEPKHIPRLTERFYRVDVARSRQSGGTGLGLAIVKHVLTRHGGELMVESEVGKGSTFTCHFPGGHFFWLESQKTPQSSESDTPGTITLQGAVGRESG